SALVATLLPGSYTAVVKGRDNTAGAGLVEIYDLNREVDSKLANLSTRALVETGANVVIAGFLLSDGDSMDRIILRGIGPSLAPAVFPVSAVLSDPALELRDANGALIVANNNWQDDSGQAAEIIAANLAPLSPFESAIAVDLPPGAYTGILS